MESIKRKLPVNDPKYIAFKNLKGILGTYNLEELRDERINEILNRIDNQS